MLPALAETRYLASAAPAVAGWEARLALEFEMRQGRTVLARRSHLGPMRVQKALYQEGPGVCQVLLVHPPGGVVGGDRLAIDIALGAEARALMTTPGAAKWYRSAGPCAVQAVDVAVGPNAVLEWLPQETIVFDGAQGALNTRVALVDSALFIGWEILCFGRTASGERYDTGLLRHSLEVLVDGRRRFGEYARIEGGSLALSARAGCQGYCVSGLMVAAGRDAPRELVGALRAVAPAPGAIGAVTTLPRVTLARCLARSAEAAREYFIRLWSLLRPALCEREALAPRIWSC